MSNLDELRHSTAHLMAAAVLKLWPNAKPTIGPTIENGFYYDFDFGKEKISEDDLPKIEVEMKKLVKNWSSLKITLTKSNLLRSWKNQERKLPFMNQENSLTFAAEVTSKTQKKLSFSNF